MWTQGSKLFAANKGKPKTFSSPELASENTLLDQKSRYELKEKYPRQRKAFENIIN